MNPLLHGIGSYDTQAVIGPARWPHHDLIIVSQGEVLFFFGKKQLIVGAGDACLIPPNNHFRGQAGHHGATIWVQHFRLQSPTTYLHCSTLQKKQAVHLPGVACGEWIRSLMHRANILQTKPKTTPSRRLVKLLLTLMFEEFELHLERGAFTSGNSHNEIQKTIEWATTQGTPFPTISQMAQHAGWSVSHFRQTFLSATGSTVGDFLREQRMREGERLLRETLQPTKEIAQKIGYSDVIAFHHAFKQHFKTTPSQYRKSFSRVV